MTDLVESRLILHLKFHSISYAIVFLALNKSCKPTVIKVNRIIEQSLQNKKRYGPDI